MTELLFDNYYSWPGRLAVWRGGELLLPDCFGATTYLRRARGLIARPPEVAAGGLLLLPCGAVHNMFMSYAIDLVFLDKDGYIIKIKENFKPWAPWAGAAHAAATLELLAGRAADLRLKVGERLAFTAAPSSAS